MPISRIISVPVSRRVGGARKGLTDTIERFERPGPHWAFYSFRDDGDWGGLDYAGSEPIVNRRPDLPNQMGTQPTIAPDPPMLEKASA